MGEFALRRDFHRRRDENNERMWATALGDQCTGVGSQIKAAFRDKPPLSECTDCDYNKSINFFRKRRKTILGQVYYLKLFTRLTIFIIKVFLFSN